MSKARTPYWIERSPDPSSDPNGQSNRSNRRSKSAAKRLDEIGWPTPQPVLFDLFGGLRRLDCFKR